MKRAFLSCFLLILWLSVAVVGVGAQQSCSAQISLTFVRAVGACGTLERNQLCYGGGMLQLSPHPSSPTSALQVGDSARLDALAAFSVQSDSPQAWSVALLRPQASLSTRSQRSLLGVLYGTATLTNEIAPTPQVRLIPRGNVNIRSQPAANAEIIARVNVNNVLMADGLSTDGAWLRVQVPNDDALGWVSREIVSLEDASVQLNTVTEATRPLQPFEHLSLAAATAPLCEGAAPSGLLLQTPNIDEAVALRVNGAALVFTGTLLINQTEAALRLSSLEGESAVVLSPAEYIIPAGAQLNIPLDASGRLQDDGSALEVLPYDAQQVALSPLNVLSRRVQLGAPLSPADITALAEARALPASVPQTPTPSDACLWRVALRYQNLRVGAGTQYAVLQAIDIGTRVYPRGQVQRNGEAWVQVGQEAWIQARALTFDGNCDAIPQIESTFVSAPITNRLSLEQCVPESNPITDGQMVEITFIPPAWENYFTALEATRYGRGFIRIGDTWRYPNVSDPVRISENEFVRRFTFNWRAEVGTYRIEGNHYAYEVICTITVVPN